MTTRKIVITEDDVRNAVRSKRLLVKTGNLKPKENLWIVDDEARLINAVRIMLYILYYEIDLDVICKNSLVKEDEVIKTVYKSLVNRPLHKPGKIPPLKTLRKDWAKFICINREIARLRMDNAKAEREQAIERALYKYKLRFHFLRQSGKSADEINKGVCELVLEREGELSNIQKIGLKDKSPAELEMEAKKPKTKRNPEEKKQ